MPAERDAAYLVRETRVWTGIFDRAKLRDGFAEDRGQADVDIIRALNWATKELIRTGQYKCYFDLAVIEDRPDYALNNEIGTILVATFRTVDSSSPSGYNTNPLTKTHITSLDVKVPGWRDVASNTPVAYHTDIPDTIVLYPPPDLTDEFDAPSLTLLAEAVVDDLAAPGDIPSRLPVQFHEDLAIGAAMRLCFSFGLMDRYLELKLRWEGPGGVVWKVREDAQHREQDESYNLIVADTYRNRSPLGTGPFAMTAGDEGSDW